MQAAADGLVSWLSDNGALMGVWFVAWIIMAFWRMVQIDIMGDDD